MALTITSNLVTISTCDADDWDLGIGTLDTDFKKEGQACLGIDTDIETNRVYKTIAQADWTGRHLYAWLMSMTAPSLDTKTNGGLQLILVDSVGNEGYWHVAGSDTYSGGWRRFIISADSTPNANNGTDPNKAQITKIGIGFKGIAKSKLTLNSFWDYVQYDTSASRGAKITDGAPDSWDEVLVKDEAACIGLIRKEAGVFYLQGTMQFGDVTTDINFADTNQILIYEDIAGSPDFHKIIVVGGAGTITNFKLGIESGGAGISGCLVKSAGNPKFQIDVSDADIDILGLYGCIFFGAGTISLSPNSANREMLNCNIEASAKLLASTCKAQNCNFIDSDADAVLINDDPHYVTDCNFISCVNGVEIDTYGDGEYDFDNLKFSGCTYDVNNSCGSPLTVAKMNGSDPSSYTGSIVTFAGSVQLTIKVTNAAGEPIVGALAYIDEEDQEPYIMNTTTNEEGIATVGYTGDPVTNARWRVRKYGYKQFRQLVDIAGDNVNLPVTLVVDPQQT